MKFFVRLSRAEILQNSDYLEVDFLYDEEPYFEESESNDLFTIYFFSLGDKNYISKFVTNNPYSDEWEEYDGILVIDEETGDEYRLQELADILSAL